MPSERPGAPKTACSSALLTSPCACGACNPHAILRRGISAVAQRCQPSCQMDEVIGYRTDWLCVCVCVCVLYLHTLMTHASHDTSWFTTSTPTNNIRYTLKDCNVSRCDAFDVFKHVLAARARELDASKLASKMPENSVGSGTKSLNSTRHDGLNMFHQLLLHVGTMLMFLFLLLCVVCCFALYQVWCFFLI